MATMVPALARPKTPPGEVKSHDRVEVGDDGLWRLGSQEPTTRSPYDQVWDNARSIRKWIERRA